MGKFYICNCICIYICGASALKPSDLNLQTLTLSNVFANTKFNTNIQNLTQVSEIVRQNISQYWCSSRQGIWLFYSEPNYSATSVYSGYVKTARGTTNRKNQVCWSLEEWKGKLAHRILSIRHVVYASLNQSALSLFTRSSNGTFNQELFIDGAALSLPEPVTFQAYAFSGTTPWLIFSETNFTGNITCLTLPLDYKDEIEQTHAHAHAQTAAAVLSFGVNVTLLAGSMRRMPCGGIEDFIQSPINSSISILGINGQPDTSPFHPGLLPSVMPEIVLNSNKSENLPPLTPWFSEQVPGIELKGENSSLLFAGNELKLTEPVEVSSLQFPTGTTQAVAAVWGLYPGFDFTGPEICVRNTGEDIEMKFHVPIHVMSVKFGCRTQAQATSAPTPAPSPVQSSGHLQFQPITRGALLAVAVLSFIVN